MKYPSECNICGESLQVGTTAFGVKPLRGSWTFKCKTCNIGNGKNRLCGSTLTRTGIPCRIRIGGASEYCHISSHNPVMPPVSEPEIFRIPDCRALREAAVLEYRENKDIYTDCAISSLSGYELDHIMELQLLRDALDVGFPPTRTNIENSNRAATVDILKQIVNDIQVLNFTKVNINKVKGEGVTEFLEDFKKGPKFISEEGMFAYWGLGKVKREESRKIQVATKAAFEFVMTNFQPDNFKQEMIGDTLHDMFVNMRLGRSSC
jgi:hypothetical protein